MSEVFGTFAGVESHLAGVDNDTKLLLLLFSEHRTIGSFLILDDEVGIPRLVLPSFFSLRPTLERLFSKS